ncbi:MAG: Na+/H+ antiporter subunit D [Bacteroidales bacterium]|nr:Na+/H+ antiporter subunit D [Bacteroidales bacterium]
MNHLILVAPILWPLAMAIIVTIFWFRRSIQSTLNVLGSAGLLVIGILLVRTVWLDGIQAVQMGEWPAPFGITIVADLFSASMVLITGIIAFALSIYSLVTIDKRRKQFGYYSLINTLYMGVCGAFVTGDLFNMYVWFEVMLISSFVLLTLGGESKQIEGTFKYVTINLISSALFLVGVGFLYGIVGTLNMADLSVKLANHENQGMITVVSMFFLASFGIKAAVFPLFFWLPASYHTPPIAITAIFAGLLTKVGVYSLIRVFTLLFVGNIDFTHTLILIISAFTMFVGVLGAASQYDMRKILSFHIISQIGYMIFGLALFTPLAIAGAIFYTLHHIIVKTNLFLVSGLVKQLKGDYDVRKIGGVLNSYPLVAILFLIPALSLAGMPPLSGFWSKFFLLKAAFEDQSYIVAAVALLVGLLTLFSMMKIWNEAFWKNSPKEHVGVERVKVNLFSRPVIFMVIPIIFLAAITVFIGFYPEPLFALASRASEQLLNPQEYINVVLGGAR